jgi:DNA repair protein SbcD/Mre11
VIKLLHFADAHIDMAGQGRHDPQTGLPYRVMDFLKALDTIVDAAISEDVKLVIFAGDAYKDRTPVPTFQREWGKRILRLSRAGIMTLLVVGNHDLSPAVGRAHALQEFETLEVPNVKVISRPCLLGPEDLGGIPIQVIGIPWVTRSAFMANMDSVQNGQAGILAELEEHITEFVLLLIEKASNDLPLIMTAHASVQGAKFGSERSVMLGSDQTLSTGLVTNPKLDYVALGHIHKSQNLNENSHPPVIYPGSIERVDFGEAADEKYYVIAEIEKGKTSYRFCRLEGRPFFDRSVEIQANELNVMQRLIEALPSQETMSGGMVRLTIYYPRELETLIDENTLRQHCEKAFEFHLLRKPQIQTRVRLPADQTISGMAPLDLLKLYWKTVGIDHDAAQELDHIAQQIINPTQDHQTS